MTAKKVTKKQIALLHVAKAQLGIGEEDYRALLRQHNAQHANELSQYAFKKLLGFFGRLGFETTAKNTAAQERLITKLASQLGLSESGYARLAERIVAKERPQTPAECAKVIEGMKAMLRRRSVVA